MAYTPTNWKNGDTITAEKLNHAEEGIKNAFSPYVVTFETSDLQNFTCDRTFEEIESAYKEHPMIGLLKVNHAVLKQQAILFFSGGDAVRGFVFERNTFEKGENETKFTIEQIEYHGDGSIVLNSYTYPEA